jgi:hypothetical protein
MDDLMASGALNFQITSHLFSIGWIPCFIRTAVTSATYISEALRCSPSKILEQTSSEANTLGIIMTRHKSQESQHGFNAVFAKYSPASRSSHMYASHF